MTQPQRADARSVGTLKIRVKRAGSEDWEDHGIHPIYAEDVPRTDQPAPTTKPEET